LEDPKAFEEFIMVFPDSPQSNLAKFKLMALTSPSTLESPNNPLPAGKIALDTSQNNYVLSGLPAFIKLRDSKGCSGCDLNGLDGVDTISLFITSRKVDLSKADLSGIYFNGSDLRNANLSGALLVGTNLKDARIDGANFDGAQFCRTHMPNQKINNDDCQAYSIKSTVYGQPAIEKFIKTKQCPGCDLSNVRSFTVLNQLNEADLSEADLRSAILFGIRFTNTNLSKANLEGSFLSKAKLNGTNLEKANLSGVRLGYSYLTRVNLRGANLSRARLAKAQFKDVDLRGANLKEADLTSVHFRSTKMDGAIFCNTKMPDGSINDSGC